ncbi:MAG: EAL domain-containing protein [Sulfuricella sp.]
MVNDFGPQSGEAAGDSFFKRLLRPSLGKKLGIVFLAFMALAAGNLFLSEKMYEGMVNTADTVNESGRLRYLSQEIAFRSATLVYEKGQDREALGRLLAKFDNQLDQVDRAVSHLQPEIRREAVKLPHRLQELRNVWRSYRALAEEIIKSPTGINAGVSMVRIRDLGGRALGDADSIVNELTQASERAHEKIGRNLRLALAVEAALMLAVFLYLRWKVILPVREISRLVSRFAAGDHSARINFKSRDEIGELARNFNQTAETVGRLIADLNRGLAELEKSQEKVRKLAMVVEGTGDSVVITDHNGIIEYVNPAFTKVTGYFFVEAVGQKPSMIKSGLTSPEYYQRLWKTLLAGEEWRGELLNRKKNGELFWESEVITALKNEAGEITHFIAVKEDVTERKSYESQLEHQANYDTLTELPNRNLSRDRLGQALSYARRHGRDLALMFIDLDHFKNINDSLGHNIGDLLLKQVSARLAGCVREGDTVARQGGDEFVVILSDVAAEEDISVVTRKILTAMAEPFDIDGHELYVSCSIGIALYPRDGEDAETLLKNADAALYRAKDLGRNNAQFFTAEMNVKAMERLMLENGLRHALERNEFVVHYQPQVDLRSGEIIGMEALVRWQHPELGLVSPARFIPVAEESGLIVPLGEWVLRTACAQNKAWQRAGLKPISVAVNLSARQFRQPNLVEVVAGILRETELDPAHLELELTESLVMHNVEVTIATLGRLKAMGIKLSIDDFGTGYSSLSYLKRFPIDMLKIDQSFVRDITTDPSDAAIAKTIISMAHDLQLRVIAEGVETEEQKSFLQQRHCDEMQGYFFSKPVPAVDFEVLLRERRCLQMADSTAALGQRTLLLLDDEENILAALTRLLRRDGYEILKATSAAAAFKLLAEHPVGVIISDQRMPEMNGTEFLRRVKQIYPDTVRMVLSGYTDLKSVTDAINEGAVYRFLTKPWDDELLRGNIQEAFQRYELAQDNQHLSDEMVSINEELNRAKRELEKRVEQKTSEARHNVGVLQISQEMLEYLPVGVIGVGEDGLIAVANRKANELFDAGNKPPLVGCFALERLPAAMIECLAGAGERRTQRLENGSDVIFWSHAMGASSGSEGRVLVIVPNEESGD